MTEERSIAVTERLYIRRLDEHDFAAMMAVYGDEQAMQFVGDGDAISEQDCLRWIDITKDNYKARGYGMMAVVRRGTDEVIGFAGLVHPQNQETPELKYAYLRETWGQGFATEAGRALVDYGLAEHDMDEVIATVAPAHIVSQKVLTKCGFTEREIQVNDDGSKTAVWARTRP